LGRYKNTYPEILLPEENINPAQAGLKAIKGTTENIRE
jgi:hypothetical protein